MSASSSKPQPPHLRLHVDTAATTATTCGSAASSGSASSSSSHSASPRAPRPTGAGAGGSGAGHIINKACASCRYQRRKCPPECPLLPYFPADQEQRFLNAHRLFGVSNIQKALKGVDPKYAHDTMRSLIYQSDARAADPVGGCVTIIEELRRQICDAEMELQFVRHQIAIYREAMVPVAAAAAAAGQQDDDMVAAAADAIYAAGQGQLPSDPVPAGGGSGGLVFDRQDHVPAGGGNDPSSHQQQLYNYFCYDNNGGNVTASDEATSGDGGMQQYGFADGSVKEEVALGDQLGQHCQIEALPFMDAFNVKPQVLPAGDVVLHPEQKKLVVATPPVKHHDVDELMDEKQATAAGAPCHLELGFSSY